MVYPIPIFPTGCTGKHLKECSKHNGSVAIAFRIGHPIHSSQVSSTMQVSLMRTLFEAHRSGLIDGQFSGVGWQRIIASYYYHGINVTEKLMLYNLKQKTSKHSANLHFSDTKYFNKRIKSSSTWRTDNLVTGIDSFKVIHRPRSQPLPGILNPVDETPPGLMTHPRFEPIRRPVCLTNRNDPLSRTDVNSSSSSSGYIYEDE